MFGYDYLVGTGKLIVNKKEGYLVETNEDFIKEIIINLKSNVIKLTTHEKKMFLEWFVKEIRVKKEWDEVMIVSVVFWIS